MENLENKHIGLLERLLNSFSIEELQENSEELQELILKVHAVDTLKMSDNAKKEYILTKNLQINFSHELITILSFTGLKIFLNNFKEKIDTPNSTNALNENQYKINKRVKENLSDSVLKERSIDFSQLEINQEKLNNFSFENFSYQQAHKELNKNITLEEHLSQSDNNSAEKYAKVLLYLMEKNPRFEKKINEAIDFIYNEFKNNFTKLIKSIYPKEEALSNYNNKSYAYSRDKTWIKWDIAKQLYYFLDKNTQRDSGYLIDNPLNNYTLREQISDRMIGWNFKEDLWGKFFSDMGIQKIKKIQETEKNNSHDGVTSKGLAKIGNELKYSDNIIKNTIDKLKQG